MKRLLISLGSLSALSALSEMWALWALALLALPVGRSQAAFPDKPVTPNLIFHPEVNATTLPELPIASTSMPPAVPFVKSGKVRPIAVVSSKRSPSLPDVPTVAELGYAGFGVARTMSLLGEALTLEPGDVVVMGTPAGVGYARTPAVWMKAGDTIEIEIERISVLSNPVV